MNERLWINQAPDPHTSLLYRCFSMANIGIRIEKSKAAHE